MYCPTAVEIAPIFDVSLRDTPDRDDAQGWLLSLDLELHVPKRAPQSRRCHKLAVDKRRMTLLPGFSQNTTRVRNPHTDDDDDDEDGHDGDFDAHHEIGDHDGSSGCVSSCSERCRAGLEPVLFRWLGVMVAWTARRSGWVRVLQKEVRELKELLVDRQSYLGKNQD